MRWKSFAIRVERSLHTAKVLAIAHKYPVPDDSVPPKAVGNSISEILPPNRHLEKKTVFMVNRRR